jgi:hypothetical protein
VKRRAPRLNASSLHEAAARALGWSLAEASGFSLPALRDLVRAQTSDVELVDEMTRAIRTGAHVATRTKPKGTVRLSQEDTLRAMGFSPAQIANFRTKG